jgi:hypothetical protein
MRLTVPFSKWLCVLVAMAILPTLMAGSPQNSIEAVVQYHCAGGSRLAADPRLSAFHKLLASRSTTNLESIARTRISCLLTNSLRLGNNPSSASLIEPLLNDVVATESLGSFGGASADAPGFILALHLGASRGQFWQESLGKIFGGGGDTFASQEFTGRRWNAGGSNSIWSIPAGEWLLVGRGEEFAPAQIQYLKQIKAEGRPVPALEQNWLEADVVSARLGGWFRLLQPARISLSVTTNQENLQIGARILTAEAIPWQTAGWQIPKDVMRGQIISFTAGQNVAAFLQMSPALAHLPGNPLTNQFYFWALDQMPLLNYMAWPVAEASNTLQRLCTEAPAALNPELERINGTELFQIPNRNALVLRNIHSFGPVLQAVRGIDGEFLFLSSFPVSPKARPAPDALLAQIQEHTNLVYYDWELTGRRLQEWQVLSKMLANRSLPKDSQASRDVLVETQWLTGLGDLPGNAVTEITRVAPNELSLTRKAPIGVTALELVLLADWVCDADSGPIHSPPPADAAGPVHAK